MGIACVLLVHCNSFKCKVKSFRSSALITIIRGKFNEAFARVATKINVVD